MSKHYEVIGLGGTFDHFHVGHEHFLRFASQWGRHLHIGVTAQKLTKGKEFAETIQDFETRKRAVQHFCKVNGISAKIFKLENIYGPTVSEESKVKALIVTEATIKGAEKINEARVASELKALPIHVCNLLRDKHGEIISAERIRTGEINRQGENYADIFSQDLKLDDTQREFFTQLQGEIVDEPSDIRGANCVVGDQTLLEFIGHDWPYLCAVYDLHEQRQAVDDERLTMLNPYAEIDNPAGTISKKLAEVLQDPPKLIRVKGEEDLAAVALMLLAPLGTKIYYGQPNEGMVEMLVTEEKKEEFHQVLKSKT